MYEKYVLLLYLKHKNLFIRDSFNISYYKMVLAIYMLSKIDFLIIIISGHGLLLEYSSFVMSGRQSWRFIIKKNIEFLYQWTLSINAVFLIIG